MTTTETDAPAPEPAADELDAGGDAPLAIEAPVDPHKEALWTRLILPARAADPLRARRAALGAQPVPRVPRRRQDGRAGHRADRHGLDHGRRRGDVGDAAPAHDVEARSSSRSSSCLIVSAGIVSLGPSEEKAIGRRRVRAAEGRAGRRRSRSTRSPGRVEVQRQGVHRQGRHERDQVRRRAPARTRSLFAEPAFTGFELNVGPPKTESGKVELKKGDDYTIFCTIPGPRGRRDEGDDQGRVITPV